MWGFPVILGGAMALPLMPFRPATMRDTWLVCGVLSSLLYVAMNLIVSTQWPEYNAASQTVSELSAIGAPTRPLWVAMAMFYTLLVTAFGWGVRMAAGDDRRLRITGILIAVYGALGFFWPLAPMHLREFLAMGGGTVSDKMHIGLATVTVVLYLVALVLAAPTLGKAFRLYSVATLAAVLVFAVATFREAPRVGLNQPTPLIGVWERFNIGVFLLWIIVLAIALLVRAHAGDRSATLRELGGQRSTA
jgi:hypothetical protein